jgi:hypothetical protein
VVTNGRPSSPVRRLVPTDDSGSTFAAWSVVGGGHRTRRALTFFIMLLGFHAGLQAQDPVVPEAAQPPQASNPRQKQPPPPFFPRHRRGIYRTNQNIEIVDATPQAPPLDIDDPGVPDNGEFEINLTTGSDLQGPERSFSLLHADVNYGVEPKLFGHHVPTQLKFECPLSAHTGRDYPSAIGVGQAAFGVKLNFYHNEHRGRSMSVYPQLEFASARSAARDLAEPGQALLLPVLFLQEFNAVTFVANAGIEKPFHGTDQRASVIAGGGLGRALTRKLALMGDVTMESAFDGKADRLLAVDIGIIYGVRHVPVYARLGHSLFSDDGAHTYFAVGIKITTPGRVR